MRTVAKTKNWKIQQDETTGNFYQTTQIDSSEAYGFWDCWKHSPCGHKLRRPHWSCIHCRFRAVANGRLPRVIPVKPFTLFIRIGRKHERIKSILLKKALELAEFLIN
jgi:hypothetical protein